MKRKIAAILALFVLIIAALGTVARPAFEQKPSTPAVTVEHGPREAENCMRYLPSIAVR